MSNTYLIYTELFIDNEWRCVDGYRMHKTYGENEEKMSLFCTFENGSRSSFGGTYSELEVIGRQVLFSELSKEIQQEHPSLKFEHSWTGEEIDTEAYYLTISYADFKAHVPTGMSRHAILHKDIIADYESGEIDEIWQDDDIDFSSLSDIEKQCYQYYEWDSHWSWQYWFKILLEKIDFTINKYINNEWIFDSPDARIVAFCL